MKRQAGTGSGSSSTSPCSIASSSASASAPWSSPAASARTRSSNRGPSDGCELERPPPSRERGATGAAARRRGAAPGRAARRAAASSCTPAVRDLDRAALAQVAPELAEEQRRAAGQLADRGGELRRRLRVGRGADERADLVVAEPAEREPRHAVEARQVGERVRERGPDLLAAVAVGRDDEQPRLGSRPREPAEQVQRLAVGPVDVVGDEQQRLQRGSSRRSSSDRRALEQVAVGLRVARRHGRAGEPLELGHEPRQHLAAVAEALRERVGLADAEQELEPLPQRLVRRADDRVRGAVEHEHAARGRLVRELAHEPRLAAARLAREQHEPALAAPRRARAASAAPPARSRGRRTGTAASARAAPEARPARGSRGSRELERRVLGQDLLLELPERRARLEPELVERRPRVAVGLERLRLPARAVEREHELAPEPLAVRMLGDQRLELADQARVAAEREVGLDPLLERRQPELLEPAGLDPRERLLAELGQRRPAPEGERLAQQARRAAGVGVARLGDEPLEAPAGRPPPARPRAGSPAAASRASRPAAACAAARRRPGRALTAVSGGVSPHSSSISRSRATTRFAFSSSSASSARCFGAPSAKRPVAVPHLQRPEQPELHRASHRVCTPPRPLLPQRRREPSAPFTAVRTAVYRLEAASTPRHLTAARRDAREMSA